MKEGYWSWRVRDDEIIIATTDTGQYVLLLNWEAVGNFQTVDAALEEAIRGTHQSVASGLRTTDLAPSEKLADWPFTDASEDMRE